MRLRHVFEFCATSAMLAGLAGIAPPEVRADPIDAHLIEGAPRILKYLGEHHYATVGVLKFLVTRGDHPAGMNAGTLNLTMATRLENALILLNDPSRPIDVIHDASASAYRWSHSATFRDGAGRRALFNHDYPVAWGGLMKRPDVFLTGEIVVGKDMKTLAFVVQCFGRETPGRIDEVLRVRGVPVDRDVLAAIGQSFAAPRGLQRRAAREVEPAGTDDDPVKLQVSYDGRPVAVEADASDPGGFRIRRTRSADPKAGQKVKFMIRNTSRDTVGVVLAVNGKNTLFEEDLATKPVAECTKWILGPGEAYAVEGFYLTEDGTNVRTFKVLPDDKSAGSDLAPDSRGVFSMIVFRPLAGSEEPDVAAESVGCNLARSPKRAGRARSLAEAQAALRTTTHMWVNKGRLIAERVAEHPAHSARRASRKGGRGLVVEDPRPTAGSNLNRVDVKLDPTPAGSLFIRYYDGPSGSPTG